MVALESMEYLRLEELQITYLKLYCLPIIPTVMLVNRIRTSILLRSKIVGGHYCWSAEHYEQH